MYGYEVSDSTPTTSRLSLNSDNVSLENEISAIYDSMPSNNFGSYAEKACTDDFFLNNNQNNRPYCHALYDFNGEFENELTFLAGEIIYLNKKIDDAWMEGESANSGLVGIFPTSFVDFCTFDSINKCISNYDLSTETCFRLVKHDFIARFDDELSVSIGDNLLVIEIIDDNWAKCQNLADFKIGIVPRNFLQFDFKNNNGGNGDINFLKETYPLEHKEIPWDLEHSLFGLSLNLPINTLSTMSVNETINSEILSEPFNLDNNKTHKQPPRPPLPKIIKSTNSTIKEVDNNEIMTFVSKSNLESDLSSCNFLNKKLKVVQDLFMTETTYLFDIDAWQGCISSSIELTDDNKRILNNGLPLLKDLSQSLLYNIQLQRDKPLDAQCYGQMFMEMKHQFFRTFSHYCRSVESVSQILENNVNVSVRNALSNCLKEMRKKGSNVFDVATALSRPINRCLKYPLYVRELLKNTTLNHCDHPKLMESLKQLENLASKINECKRRKELIRKYQCEQPLTLTERLSRLNVHSFVKKSNRLKYRISSTIGLNSVCDNEFNFLISLLNCAERKVCKFLYCVQLYKKAIDTAFKKYEENFKDKLLVADEPYVKIISVFISELDASRKMFLEELEKRIIIKGKNLIHYEYTKLIHKRCDKLADYETANEIETRRNEYEALNNQIKNTLPKLVATINKTIIELIQGVHKIDDKLINEINALIAIQHQDAEKGFLFFGLPLFNEFLSNCSANRFYEIDKILGFKVATEEEAMLNANKNQATCLSSSFRVTKSSKSKQNALKFSKVSNNFLLSNEIVRSQTSKERDALVKIGKTQDRDCVNLRIVRKKFSTANINLNVDDVVIVKGYKDGKCLCDNSVSIDSVPIEYLRLFDEITEEVLHSLEPLKNSLTKQDNAPTMPFSLPALESSKRKSQAEHKNSISFEEFVTLFDAAANNKTCNKSNSFNSTSMPFNNKKDAYKLNGDLINLNFTENECLSNFDFSLIHYDKEPMRKRTGHLSSSSNFFPPTSLYPHSSSLSNLKTNLHTTETETKTSKVQKAPFAGLFRLAIDMPIHNNEDRVGKTVSLTCSQSLDNGSKTVKVSETPIIPIRKAPLPPLPLPVVENFQGEKNNVIMKCGYDFNPIVENSDSNVCPIPMCEGELVNVLQRHDDANNTEWWLVCQLATQKIGYIPANYLLPL